MAFEDIYKRLDNIRGNADLLRKEIKKVEDSRRKLQIDLDVTNSILRDGNTIRKSAFYLVKAKHSGEFFTILENHIIDAISKVDEFNSYPKFQNNLLEAIKVENPIRVNLNRNFSVEIKDNLDTIAGTLSDYAKGITFARSIIKREEGARKNPYDPKKASRYWANVIWGSKGAKYTATMQLRFEGFSKMAPFWRLLDEGVPQPLASDRGGFPTPTSEPTHFARLAEHDIQSKVQEYVSIEENEYIDRLHTNREKIIDKLNELRVILLDLYKLLEEATGEEFKVALRVVEEFLDRIEGRLDRADPTKVKRLSSELLAGEAQDRVSLGGYAGGGSGVRPRTILLSRELERELQKAGLR